MDELDVSLYHAALLPFTLFTPGKTKDSSCGYGIRHTMTVGCESNPHFANVWKAGLVTPPKHRRLVILRTLAAGFRRLLGTWLPLQKGRLVAG